MSIFDRQILLGTLMLSLGLGGCLMQTEDLDDWNDTTPTQQAQTRSGAMPMNVGVLHVSKGMEVLEPPEQDFDEIGQPKLLDLDTVGSEGAGSDEDGQGGSRLSPDGDQQGPDPIPWRGSVSEHGGVPSAGNQAMDPGDQSGPDPIPWRGSASEHGGAPSTGDQASAPGEQSGPDPIPWRERRSDDGVDDRASDLGDQAGPDPIPWRESKAGETNTDGATQGPSAGSDSAPGSDEGGVPFDPKHLLLLLH